jgi:hypothetical protein
MAFTVTSGMCFLNAETVSTTGVAVFDATPESTKTTSGRASRKWSFSVSASSAAKLLVQVSPLHELTAAGSMTSANSVMMASGTSLNFVAPYDCTPITKIQVRGAGGVSTFTANKTG